VKRIYVIESLCNGCRLCEAFCSSLADGVFGAEPSRIKVVTTPGEEKDLPLVQCSGRCPRPLFEPGTPTCVALCPTGALIFEELDVAAAKRLELEAARQAHSIFGVIAPWKWPFPWHKCAREGDER